MSGDVWHASKRTVDAPQVFNLPPCDRFPSPSALPRRSCEPKKSHSRNPQAVKKRMLAFKQGEKKRWEKETLKVWGAKSYLVWMIFIWKNSKDDCHRKCWIIPITLCCMYHLLVGHLSQFQFNSWLHTPQQPLLCAQLFPSHCFSLRRQDRHVHPQKHG